MNKEFPQGKEKKCICDKQGLSADARREIGHFKDCPNCQPPSENWKEELRQEFLKICDEKLICKAKFTITRDVVLRDLEPIADWWLSKLEQALSTQKSQLIREYDKKNN